MRKLHITYYGEKIEREWYYVDAYQHYRYYAMGETFTSLKDAKEYIKMKHDESKDVEGPDTEGRVQPGILDKLREQRAVLVDVAKEYSGRNIDNIIQNHDARIKYMEGQQ